MNEEQLEALLRARAHVEMPADYTEKLLRNLHQRQRSELLQRSLWQIARERLSTFWGEHSLSTPTFALSLAAVFALGLAAIFLLKPSQDTPVMARQIKDATVPLQTPVEALPVHFQK